MIISAFAELVSLAAVVPFLSVLAAPDFLFSLPYVKDVADSWGEASAEQLLLPFTVIFVLAALTAGMIRILLLWAGSRLAFAFVADLGVETYRRTLHQPFNTHAVRNSSELISGITKKTESVGFGVLLPMLTLMSSLIVVIAITLALLAIEPVISSLAAVTFGGIYGLIIWVSRRQLKLSSQCIANEQNRIVQALQEGLGGIRDVLMSGAQQMYCDIYRNANYPLWRAQHHLGFISGSPKFAMESIGTALIAALAFGMSRQPGASSTVIPMLGALALAGQRLIPALQQSYSSWVSIAGSQASLADVLELMDQSLPAEIWQSDVKPLLFQDAISFENVWFRYSCDGPWIVEGLNFSIPKGNRIGFVGRTGSGKSTTIDLLIGLLEPNEGRILVDGRSIDGARRRAWQKNIAHVPQSIYLADTSFAENIAFGEPIEAIDFARVREAARQAQIAKFIESQAEGYRQLVGERGIRLSGGQRQRIGIARALYKQASVLIFDEGTSALDSATENAVLEAIESLNRDITICIIAHRLTTVRRCDTVLELKHGRISVTD